jgi:plastocyanin
MRGFSALILSLAVLTAGCQKAEEVKPSANNEPVSASPSTPAPAEPAAAEPAAPPAPEALAVPPAEAPKDPPKPEVILPSTEPDPPAAPEAPAAPEKTDGSALDAPSTLLPVAATEEAGTLLKGRFVFDGTPPAPVQLEITKDQECCGKYPKELVDESLVVGADGGIAHIFIYVRTKDVKVTPEAEKSVASTVRLENSHCRFEPHSSIVWAGKQTVVFGNKDPINHAVKIDPLDNQAINNQLPSGTDFQYQFTKQERIPVGVYCGIHPWQKGWILPTEHPYAAVTAADGSFTINNLPARKLEFQVWQEKAGYLVAKSDWKRGRFEMEIKPGVNDLGVIKVSPSLFEKK